jgi:hypothetical protein
VIYGQARLVVFLRCCDRRGLPLQASSSLSVGCNDSRKQATSKRAIFETDTHVTVFLPTAATAGPEVAAMTTKTRTNGGIFVDLTSRT